MALIVGRTLFHLPIAVIVTTIIIIITGVSTMVLRASLALHTLRRVKRASIHTTTIVISMLVMVPLRLQIRRTAVSPLTPTVSSLSLGQKQSAFYV